MFTNEHNGGKNTEQLDTVDGAHYSYTYYIWNFIFSINFLLLQINVCRAEVYLSILEWKFIVYSVSVKLFNRFT